MRTLSPKLRDLLGLLRLRWLQTLLDHEHRMAPGAQAGPGAGARAADARPSDRAGPSRGRRGRGLTWSVRLAGTAVAGGLVGSGGIDLSSYTPRETAAPAPASAPAATPTATTTATPSPAPAAAPPTPATWGPSATAPPTTAPPPPIAPCAPILGTCVHLHNDSHGTFDAAIKALNARTTTRVTLCGKDRHGARLRIDVRIRFITVQGHERVHTEGTIAWYGVGRMPERIDVDALRGCA